MRNNQSEEVITWANNEFARINGFSNSDACIGFKISNLFIGDEIRLYHEFVETFERAANVDGILTDYWLEFTNRNQDLKQVFIHAKPIYKEAPVDNLQNPKIKKKIIGRVGSMVDISDNVKHQLNKEVDEDYAAFLHLFSAFVHDIKTTMISIIRGHSTDVLTGIYDVDVKKAFHYIGQSTKRLDIKINRYLNDALQKGIVQESFLSHINMILAKLDLTISDTESYSSLNLKGKASDIRRNLMDIRKRIRETPNLKMTRSEDRKEIESEIAEGLRFARLISLWQAVIQSDGMAADLDILSRALKPHSEIDYKEYSHFSVIDVLNDVKSDLLQYAKNERVAIKIVIEHGLEETMYGISRNIYVAFFNLLHNAIKYTWKKPSMTESNVNIKIFHSKNSIANIKQLAILFENRGDEILKEEKHKIFKFGYRGIRAVNGRKKGTGVGLWHAKKIINEHKGEIIPESKPINDKSYNFNQVENNIPFITTMLVTLPIEK